MCRWVREGEGRSGVVGQGGSGRRRREGGREAERVQCVRWVGAVYSCCPQPLHYASNWQRLSCACRPVCALLYSPSTATNLAPHLFCPPPPNHTSTKKHHTHKVYVCVHPHTCSVTSCCCTSTPRSAGLMLLMGFFFAFMMLGRVAYLHDVVTQGRGEIRGGGGWG